MKVKPVILILQDKKDYMMTSVLKREIEALGKHYVVVLKRNQYNNKFKRLFDLDKLVMLFVPKRQKKEEIKKEGKDRKVRRNRIYNATLRFNPLSIVTLSPHTHSLAIDAKRKTLFDVPIIAVMPSFTLDKDFLDQSSELFLVENREVKTQIEQFGIAPRDVASLGLPIDTVEKAEDKKVLREDIGLGEAPTIFFNAVGKRDIEVFDLLLDQGSYINIIAYCDDAEIFARLRALTKIKAQENVVLFEKQKDVDEYLSASDFVVSGYDISILYKAFSLNLPVIALRANNSFEKAEWDYLTKEGYICYANESLDVVDELYKLIQTPLGDEIAENLSKRKLGSHIDNVAYFIVERSLQSEPQEVNAPKNKIVHDIDCPLE